MTLYRAEGLANFSVSSTTTGWTNVDSMVINNISLAAGDVVRITFNGVYGLHIPSGNGGTGSLRYVLTGPAGTPMIPEIILGENWIATDQMGSPYIAVYSVGADPSQLPPGNYSVQLSAICYRVSNDTQLNINSPYYMWVERIRS